jgi:hypothetical protein
MGRNMKSLTLSQETCQLRRTQSSYGRWEGVALYEPNEESQDSGRSLEIAASSFQREMLFLFQKLNWEMRKWNKLIR